VTEREYWWTGAVGLLGGAFLSSAVLTVLVRRIALRIGFVATPRNDRYHRGVVPLGGGVAIFWTIAVALLGGIVVVRAGLGHLGDMPSQIVPSAVLPYVEGFANKTGPLLIVLAVALGLHLVGLWDDRRGLGPGVKLLAQVIAATVAAVFADIRVELFIENRIVTTLLSVLWMVVIINAFNFLDNMDAAAAGIALIVSAVLFWAAALAGQVLVSGMALLLIGALAGFLLFNWPPARIFMGDAGSLVVGFLVALLTLRTTYYRQDQGGGVFAVFMPLVVMAVPLYDFTSVTLLRLTQGRSPFVGDTQHFSHRLRRRGLDERQTVLTLYLATLCTAVGAVFLYQVNLLGAVLIFAQTVMILAIIAVFESTGRNDTSS